MPRRRSALLAVPLVPRAVPLVLLAVPLVLVLPAGVASQAPPLPPAAPEEVGMSSERLARMDRVLGDAVAAAEIAGMVTLVARDGRLVHHRAYGVMDLSTGEPMRRDALLRTASFSKALTSVAAMILVEEGRLLLGDPVSRWLPAFAETGVAVADSTVPDEWRVEPARRQITVRDLLTHTSGLSYCGTGWTREEHREADLCGWYFADDADPIGAAMGRLARLPLSHHPGEAWTYGYSTDLLGHVIERVSGTSLDAFLRTRILEPLGMRDTGFYVDPADRGRLAAVHGIAEDGTLARGAEDGSDGQGAYVDGPRTAFSGGAGLVSTMGDYARFLQMLLDGGELDGTRILAPGTVALMTSDHAGELYRATGQAFGLGFQVLEDPGAAAVAGRPGAYGWGSAYYGSYWVDPEERLVAIFLSQLNPARGLDLQARFRNLVYQAVVEPVPGG